MECPNCTATLPDDDIFCEECGVRLVEEQAPEPVPGGCSCGAGPGEVDEDGFCTRCGKRVRPRPEDHIEIVVSPDFAAVSDRGLRHDRNEDRAAIRAVPGAAAATCILVVCDGVSSSYDSQTAAETAAETILEALAHESTMQDAFADAATRAAALGRAGEAPSTTAVAARIADHTIEIGWVGDSRAYWIDGAGAKQLTRDHSWLNDVVASGEITFDEAVKDQRAHAITRWLGGDAGENALPEITQFEIPGAGALLFCTDGLWNYAPAEPEIAKAVNDAGLPDGADALTVCRRLIDFAKEQGGHDNITAALLRFPEPEDKQNGERIPS